MLGVASVAMAQQVADANSSPARVLGADDAAAVEEVAGMPLAYFDQAYMNPARDAAMRAEVVRILETAGVPVDDMTEAALSGGRRSVYGFLLRIVIRDASPIAWDLPDHAMGVTIGRQMPPSNVYLFYPSIVRVLGIEGGRRKSLTDEEIGRALGRVVVHELVHAFAPDHEHGGWGIMGHAQDRHSLTVAGATLDEESAGALMQGWNRAQQVGAERE